MKKMKKLASLLLVLVMSLALAVPAFAAARESTYETQSRHIKKEGLAYEYEAYTSIYQGINSGACKAAVWVSEMNYKCPPARSMSAEAILCDASGDTIQSVEDENTANEYFIFPTTNMYGDGWIAKGYVWLAGYGSVTLPNVSPSRRSLQATLKAVATEDGKYPVNARGETYGSTLMAEIVGEEPDLVSAIGVDGIKGYVRSADLFAKISDSGAEIPLFDLSGNIIGCFEKHYNDTAISVASIEEAQTAVASQG